jgi:dTDP-4-amino-4,6-dideoxygalactose transaminase
MTFTASAEVIRYLGAEAVFVDVVKGGYHIDPAALENTLERLRHGLPAYAPRSGDGEGFGPRGKAAAIMPVHYGGLPCDMNAILPVAEKYGVKIVEDAAHSFPSLLGNGVYAGTIGDAGVFSFYATKTITTGEGGMVVTGKREIAERVRIMRLHGIDRSVFDRYTNTKASWYYEVTAPGFKYNMPDLLSALGRVQLRRAATLLEMRKKIARTYDEAFGNDSRFIIPPTGEGDARHLYPLRLRLETLSINRNDFAAGMQEQGIGISVHFIPLHIMPYYRERYSLEKNDFPETMDSYSRSVSFPIWPGMTESQINRIIEVVKTLAS